MEKNAKIGTFFYKERKRTQRSERFFIKNGKVCKDRKVVLKRTDAQPWRDAGFEAGTTVSVLWSSDNEPPHLRNHLQRASLWTVLIIIGADLDQGPSGIDSITQIRVRPSTYTDEQISSNSNVKGTIQRDFRLPVFFII